MNTLTANDTLDMHFADICDADVNYESGEQAAYESEMEYSGSKSAAEISLKRYRRGKELLSQFYLKSTIRQMSTQPWYDVPEDALGAIAIESGYIATSPAWRIYYAVPR